MTKQNNPFNVSGHEKYYNYIKPVLTNNKRDILAFVSACGRALEKNMGKEQEGASPLLTKKTWYKSYAEASRETFVPNAYERMVCLHTLAVVWNRGLDVCACAPQQVDRQMCELVRAMTNDHAFTFFENYPDAGKLDTSTPEGQERENARVLATVLPAPELIDLFWKCASSSKKTRDNLISYLPQLKLPPSEIPDATQLDYNPELAGIVKDTWREDLKAVCEGAKKRLNEVKVAKAKNNTTEI